MKKVQAKTASMDMLHGPMLKKMLIFALPLAAGSILQQLFNAVDVAVVGRYASSQALAAVGANASVVTLLINLFVGISVGSNVIIAHYIGKGEQDRVNGAVHTSVLLAILSGIGLMILGIVIAGPLLKLMSTPDDVLDQAVVYLRIYCVGMPFIMVYNFGAAILRSVGDTKKPLYCLIVSGIVNAGLNMIFVIVFHMGVSGVAIATTISNVISAGMILFFIQHGEEILHLDKEKMKIRKEELLRILQIGVPTGIQGMVFSIANVLIQASVNSFGSDAVAGSAVAINFEYISYFAVNGFNQAVMTFVSQNYGAGDRKRCKKALVLGMACAVITDLTVVLIFYLNRTPLIGIFTADPAVTEFVIIRMRYVMLVHFLICSYEITGSALRGLGKSMVPAILTIFGTCILRITYVKTVVPAHHSFDILMMVYPISWIVTGVMVISALFVVWRRMANRVQNDGKGRNIR